MKIVLASASPRRGELIKKITDDVTITPTNVDESVPQNLTPPQKAMEISAKKARAIAVNGDEIVLGADTIVVLGDTILGKPKNAEQAVQFFKLLCGKTHEVITGFTLRTQAYEHVDYESTRVTFAPYDESIVSAYVASGSPMDKAGGYGIQDEAISPLIVDVDGELDNVIGLPTEKIKRLIKEKFIH